MDQKKRAKGFWASHFAYPQNFNRIVLCVLVLFVSASCGKIGDISAFNANNLRGILATATTGWLGPMTVDVGTTALEVNNDTDATCNVASMWTGARGCMQQPALVYSDSRWHLGFTQDYLPSAGQKKFSAFANMTSLVTGLFGALGTGLGLIDSGYGLVPGFATTSSRYIRFAKFPNGNVVAIFWVEEPLTTERTVYANIYNATSNTWGVAQRLGTAANSTDDGTDYDDGGVSKLTPFCRPSVATAGDGSAMAFWCEDTAAQPSQILYSRYSAGAWSAAASLVEEPSVGGISQEIAFPGTDGILHDFSGQFGNINTAASSGTADVFAAALTVSNGVTFTSSVTAVESNATTGEFNVVRDGAGTILFCETMNNMINAMLGQSITVGATTSTLSQLGASIVLNPTCLTDPVTVDATPAQWTIAMFYNRALLPLFRNTEAVGVSVQNIVVGLTKTTGAGAIVNTVYTALNPQDKYMRSAMVDVAGDSLGNYAIVRSVPAPFYQQNDISNAGIGKGRMLIGHQYVVGSGFIQRADRILFPISAASVNEPQATAISSIPTCFNGTQQIGCSVRGAKIHMSDAGKGLVLYYQPQPGSFSGTAPTGADIATTGLNPTRLWFGSYSLATGFSSGGILDQDTFCSTSSIRNDQSVCETASYDAAGRCQNVGEPRDALTAALINHDVPPIASAMNASGKAVIVYHKKFLDTSSVCTNVGTFVVTYDSTNGLSSTTQIDDQGGDTMHANVAINSNGDIAVVWESIKTAVKYVYLKTYINGSWSSQMQMNDGYTDSTDSMMPSVGINDAREIVVSFTYGNGTTTPQRRQFVKQYIPR